MGYVIKTKNSTYVNFELEKPKILDLIQRFDACTVTGENICMEYFTDLSCKRVEVFISGIRYSYVFVNNELETCFVYIGLTTYDIFSYKGNNLHGSILVNFEGKKYVVHMNHGRYSDMYVFNGEICGYGTQMQKIEFNEYVWNYLSISDYSIRELLK